MHRWCGSTMKGKTHKRHARIVDKHLFVAHKGDDISEVLRCAYDHAAAFLLTISGRAIHGRRCRRRRHCAAVLLNRRHGQARSVDEVSSQEGGRGDKRRESGLETHGTRSEKKTDEEKAMAIFIKADRGMFCARQFTPCGRKVCAVKIIWPYYIIYFPF